MIAKRKLLALTASLALAAPRNIRVTVLEATLTFIFVLG